MGERKNSRSQEPQQTPTYPGEAAALNTLGQIKTCTKPLRNTQYFPNQGLSQLAPRPPLSSL